MSARLVMLPPWVPFKVLLHCSMLLETSCWLSWIWDNLLRACRRDRQTDRHMFWQTLFNDLMSSFGQLETNKDTHPWKESSYTTAVKPHSHQSVKWKAVSQQYIKSKTADLQPDSWEERQHGRTMIKDMEMLLLLVLVVFSLWRFLIFLTDFSLPRSRGGGTYGWRQFPCPDESPVDGRALDEHLWGRYLAQGYLGDALKVFWHPLLLPEQLPPLWRFLFFKCMNYFGFSQFYSWQHI